jgi:hypothetical protein
VIPQTILPLSLLSKVGDVDATVQEQLAQQYGVKGYPTIFSYFGGKAEPYQGGRTTGDIVNYALEMLEKHGGWEPTIPQVVSQGTAKMTCFAIVVVTLILMPT